MTRKSQPNRQYAAFETAREKFGARRKAEEAELQAKLAVVTPLEACQAIAEWWAAALDDHADLVRAISVGVPVPLVRTAVAAAARAKGGPTP